MTPDQQNLYARFNQTVIDFEKAVEERELAKRAFGHRTSSNAGRRLQESKQFVEEVRAELLDAYTSLLVQGES